MYLVAPVRSGRKGKGPSAAASARKQGVSLVLDNDACCGYRQIAQAIPWRLPGVRLCGLQVLLEVRHQRRGRGNTARARGGAGKGKTVVATVIGFLVTWRGLRMPTKVLGWSGRPARGDPGAPAAVVPFWVDDGEALYGGWNHAAPSIHLAEARAASRANVRATELLNKNPQTQTSRSARCRRTCRRWPLRFAGVRTFRTRD